MFNFQNEYMSKEQIQLSQEEGEWKKGYDAFLAKYPDFPVAKPIDCLNLIMKKEFAEEILQGKKTVEFRVYSKHYRDRLYDKETGDYIEAHSEDDEFIEGVQEYGPSLRFVRKIHFHNYNNTWYLDVEVKSNDVCTVTKDDVHFMQEEFNCHELDEELEYFEKKKISERPLLFYFALGNVIDTNLPH